LCLVHPSHLRRCSDRITATGTDSVTVNAFDSLSSQWYNLSTTSICLQGIQPFCSNVCPATSVGSPSETARRSCAQSLQFSDKIQSQCSLVSLDRVTIVSSTIPSRRNSFLAMAAASSGTTVGRPYTMLRTWDMPGNTAIKKTSPSLHGPTETMSLRTYYGA
jgi:hypothetical protein